MIIGDRLRELREAKKLSQGDIEKRTGSLRSYLSRVENGHTVPSLETLEKLAHALEVSIYQLFYDGEEPPELPNLPNARQPKRLSGVVLEGEAHLLNKFRRLIGRMNKLLFVMAQRLTSR